MDSQIIPRKLKIARFLQWMIAICYILIGLLHTDVHFRELASEPYALALSKIQGLELMGLEADIWKLWQGFSLMMGGCFVIIGLLNVSALLNSKGGPLPISFLVIILAVLTLGTIAGVYYFGAFQSYGGIFGMALQTVAIVLTIASRNG